MEEIKILGQDSWFHRSYPHWNLKPKMLTNGSPYSDVRNVVTSMDGDRDSFEWGINY